MFLTSHAQTDSLPANTNEALTKENFASKTTLNNKTSIYKINSAVDIPIVVTGTAWSLFAFTKMPRAAATAAPGIA